MTEQWEGPGTVSQDPGGPQSPLIKGPFWVYKQFMIPKA